MPCAFTLMEVLIAVIIIGLGALGLSAMFAGAAGQQRRADMVNQSVQLAQNGAAMVLRSFGRMEGRTPGDPPDGVWERAVADDEEYFLTTADRSYVVVLASEEVYSLSASQFASTFVQAPPPPDLPPLAHSRIHRNAEEDRSIEIRVTVVEDTGGLGGLGASPASQTYTYREKTPMSSGEPNTVTATRVDDPFKPDRFDVDRAESGQPGQTGRITPVNLISLVQEFEMDNNGVTTAFVSKIEVDYEWRNDNLVSLNDRLLFLQDERMPGGRRPHLGYTLLTRVANGVSQLAILTYAMEPLSVPAIDPQEEPIFIPPETQARYDIDQGLLREAEMTLGWEEATGLFFITPKSDDDEWVIEQGQLVFVKALNQSDPGADGGVRIVAVRRVRDGSDVELRGVLDGSPRVLGRSPLRDLNNRVDLTVFAFPASVQSLTSDETEWAIRPIEARVVQATAP